MHKRVIVDIDAGTDDAVALILLLFAEQNKEIEIVAISCVNGNTTVGNVYKNVQRILKLCNRQDIPVYTGASEPLILSETPIPHYFHGKDGFGDLEFEIDDLTIKDTKYNQMTIAECEPLLINTNNTINNNDLNSCSDTSAIVMLNKIVSETPNEISLICLGPLTNIALTMKVYSQFANCVKDIFIMGGNHKGVGNVTSAAEFNFHVDPEAAYIVLHYSKCPITILPWEPCMDSTLTFDWRYSILGTVDHPMMKLLNAAEKRIYPEEEKIWIPCDALLVAAFLNPNTVKHMFECNASVELQGHKTRAQVVINHMKELVPNVSIVTEIDYELFKTLLLKSFGHK